MNLLLKPSEAAEELGIGMTLLYDLIAKGVLGSVKIGRARRIPSAGLEAYVSELAEHEIRGLPDSELSNS